MTVSASDNPGIWLVAASIRQQRKAGTNTETDRPTETIVCDGLYRYSRNTLYVGFVLTYLGKFGDEYWSYRDSVRRWL